MSKENLAPAVQAFLDEVAALLAPWGMPATSARLYGYLLLQWEPVSLDELASALGVSKSTASVAARVLEEHLLARRSSEPGSRRVSYRAADSVAGFLEDKSALLGRFGALLEERAGSLAEGAAAERLAALGRFWQAVRRELDALVAELDRLETTREKEETR